MGNGSRVPLGQPLFGGYASAPIPGISVRNADLRERMGNGDPSVVLDHRTMLESKDVHGDWKFELIARIPEMYKEGDLLFGYGDGGPSPADPLERPAEMIIEDLKKNIISDWTAENVYRVALDPERRKVDSVRTQELRTAERKARLMRGKSFDEFLNEWSKKSPPQEILQWYGSWPDAKSTGPVFRP